MQGGESALPALRVVQQRPRRRAHRPPEHLEGTARGAEHLRHHRADVLRGEPGDVQHLAGPAGQIGDRVDDQVDVAGRRVRDPRLLRQIPRPPVDVQDGGGHVDGADPVDHRVVGLVDQGDPAAGQPLDDVDLPQRPGAIQRAGDQPADQFVQLDVGARLRDRGTPDVVGDVEVLVVDPDRPGQPTRHEPHLLPVPGHQVQPRLDQVDDLRVLELRAVRVGLEDDDAADVHRCAGVLGVQERGVRR